MPQSWTTLSASTLIIVSFLNISCSAIFDPFSLGSAASRVCQAVFERPPTRESWRLKHDAILGTSGNQDRFNQMIVSHSHLAQHPSEDVRLLALGDLETTLQKLKSSGDLSPEDKRFFEQSLSSLLVGSQPPNVISKFAPYQLICEVRLSSAITEYCPSLLGFGISYLQLSCHSC